MGYLFFSVFLVLMVFTLLLVSKWARKQNDAGMWPSLFVGIAGAMLTVVVVITFFFATYQIPAGHVGVVYRFGKIVNQLPEGLQFIPPWEKVTRANVQVQSWKFPKLSSFSQETQDVFVAATLNISISPKDIQDLYRNVGENFFNVLVAPRVEQNFKDETVKYKSVDIAPNREAIRKTVRDRLERELTQYSIQVKDLLLENIDFNPGFKAAIENKQRATQKALEEEQNVKVKKQLAEQAIESAKGQAQAVLINAEKQAEANRKLSASLTPELIQYTMIQKLSDKIEVMILPAGQSFILSPEMLKKSDKKPEGTTSGKH
jgi:prohibitin 2